MIKCFVLFANRKNKDSLRIKKLLEEAAFSSILTFKESLRLKTIVWFQ